jgi:hypothetical protein
MKKRYDVLMCYDRKVKNVNKLGFSTVGDLLISMSILSVYKIRKNATFINRVVI